MSTFVKGAIATFGYCSVVVHFLNRISDVALVIQFEK